MVVASRPHIQTRRGNNVRIGPISIITLIVVICMAILAVLAASTSYASTTISQRQAEGARLLYLNECAGQEFVAGIDDVLYDVRLAGGTSREGAQALEGKLDAICAQARQAAGGRVDCTANVEGTTVNAEFTCEDKRRLVVAITILDDGTYRIRNWKMTSVQQAPQSTGTLWMGAE